MACCSLSSGLKPTLRPPLRCCRSLAWPRKNSAANAPLQRQCLLILRHLGTQVRANSYGGRQEVLAGAHLNVPVRLIVPELHLQFGEQLKCVGENAALGNWYSSAAPFLSWTEGDAWIHHSQLPPGQHRFKLVIVRDGGSIYWEEGRDRVFEIPEVDEEGSIVEISCEFGVTSHTNVAIIDGTGFDEEAASLQNNKRGGEVAEADAQSNGDDDSAGASEELDVNDTSPSTAQDAEGLVEASGLSNNGVTSGDGPEEPISADSDEMSEPQEATPPNTSPKGNGSSFKTYGSATAAVIDDSSVVVTFSDDDQDDMLSLAEQLLGSNPKGDT